MIHCIDDLAYNGPGSDMPIRPKGDLASLLGNKKPNILCSVELHKYLIKSLRCAEIVNQPDFAGDGFCTDLDQISPDLVACYEQVKKHNAVGLRVFLEYGYRLELAYELFRRKKWKGQNNGIGTWQEWLTVNVGIFPRYSQKLREVAKLLQNYYRFQNVGISFSEIYHRNEQITNVLQTNSIAACYWWGVDPISG